MEPVRGKPGASGVRGAGSRPVALQEARPRGALSLVGGGRHRPYCGLRLVRGGTVLPPLPCWSPLPRQPPGPGRTGAPTGCGEGAPCAPTCTAPPPRATALSGTAAAGCWFGGEHTRRVTANGSGWQQRGKQGPDAGKMEIRVGVSTDRLVPSEFQF